MSTHDPSRDGLSRSDSRFGLRLVLVAGAFLVGVVPFTLLALLVRNSWSPLQALDVDIARTMEAWMSARPRWRRLAHTLSDWVWDPFVFRILVLVLCVWLWRRGARRLVLWAVTAMVIAAALSGLTKVVIARARPEDAVTSAPGGSFPSGHTLTATVGAGVLLLILLPVLPRRSRPVVWCATVVSAFGVGCTRVALGTHYLSDVVGGWILGIAVLAATSGAFAWWRHDTGPPAPDTDAGLEPGIHSAKPGH
ncbi:phosphatase PAP2 family protein [Embleya sp. NPDC050154]|uniref:phosphatase PAP2 family protein n=1 Tax=Embleya sp. NPDC050154 TaxID=3363988 RepID=UPI00379F6210